MASLTFFFTFVLLAAATLYQGIKVVAENQRMVVFRFGKLWSTLGPGLHFILPFYDKGILVDLNKEIPGWMSMSEADLVKKVRERALSQPIA